MTCTFKKKACAPVAIPCRMDTCGGQSRIGQFRIAEPFAEGYGPGERLTVTSGLAGVGVTGACAAHQSPATSTHPRFAGVRTLYPTASLAAGEVLARVPLIPSRFSSPGARGVVASQARGSFVTGSMPFHGGLIRATTGTKARLAD